ncbi:MAG: pyridoxal 5'-phosphate synthase glutaminase subunit PdxT [Tannerellaceae bacterium]|nr:pyridoxal 5'-phosphate synthase glutaminase subunit PdxT [Tannerellaceae bacterium]
MNRKVIIGILALQGGFIEHIRALNALGAETFEIRKKDDLRKPADGLILPGGESTTMSKLLTDLDMFNDLKAIISGGMPVFATCAGMILLARKIAGTQTVHLGIMDITVKRNAYGRQLGSFFVHAPFQELGMVPMTFIRAPFVESAGATVSVLSIVDDRIVAVRQGNMLATAFHPELNTDNRIHQYFIEKIVFRT